MMIMRNNRLSVFFTLLLCGITSSFAATTSLSPIEHQITQIIQAQKTEQLALLEQLVNINSGTNNIKGVRQVGEILRPQFEQLGFTTAWVEEPATMHRAATFIAKQEGNKGKRILLIGHLDTVFPAESSFQHFKRQGDTATGPGVIDDKGGDVVILFALKALKAAHALDGASITVVLTGDEEDSGKPTTISRRPLIDAARQSDIALDFELATSADTATIARRGITNWTIEAQGTEAHSSEIFRKTIGDGAVFELTRILNTMRVELAAEPYLSFNPGIILGGTTINYRDDNAQGQTSGKENIIAKLALAKGDLRFISSAQQDMAKNKLAQIVSQHLPETTASISFQDGIPSMPPTKANKSLLDQYSGVSYRLGYGRIKPLDPGLRGAGDISHIAAFVHSALAGLGPIGTGAHSAKETLDIASLAMQTERTALLIYELAGKEKTQATL